MMNPFKWLAWKLSQHIWDWAYFAEPCHEWWLYHSMMWMMDYSPSFNSQPMEIKKPMTDFKYGPESTPAIKGKAAKEFLKRIEQGPTEKQKAILAEAKKVYSEIKKK